MCPRVLSCCEQRTSKTLAAVCLTPCWRHFCTSPDPLSLVAAVSFTQERLDGPWSQTLSMRLHLWPSLWMLCLGIPSGPPEALICTAQKCKGIDTPWAISEQGRREPSTAPCVRSPSPLPRPLHTALRGQTAASCPGAQLAPACFALRVPQSCSLRPPPLLSL